MTENHEIVSTDDHTTQPIEDTCPVPHGQGMPRQSQGPANTGRWPDRLNLKVLAKNPSVANPLGADFDYAEAFASLDLAAVKVDIAKVLTTSQDWWPIDFNNYGPLVIRMAGTLRARTASTTVVGAPVLPSNVLHH